MKHQSPAISSSKDFLSYWSCPGSLPWWTKNRWLCPISYSKTHDMKKMTTSMKEKKNLYLKNDLRNALTTGSYYQVLLTLFCWLKAEQYHSCFTLCTEHAGCCSPPEPRVWAGWPYAGMQNNDWLMHRLNENSLRFRCGFEHFQRVCCFADSSFDSTPFKYFNEIKIWHIKLVM